MQCQPDYNLVEVSLSLKKGIVIPGITACGSAELHNKYRRFHKSTPDVDGSNELVKLSQQCASQIIQTGKSTCDHEDSYGINIAILPSVSRTSHLEELMAAWYSELDSIKFNSKGYENLHYNASTIANATQIIWRSTQKVGCSGVTHPGRHQSSVYVCFYSPRGNYFDKPTDIILNLKPRITPIEAKTKFEECKDDYPEECKAIERRKAEHVCHFDLVGFKGKVNEYCRKTCGLCS
ncbi:uncharacterized protein [Clytia hemisphaerica]|uniref:uncharacterized protein isoform X2 n=1 Tax=Clytia hemisphaerica TaxID=252671 RepID=UPI0034D3F275